RLKNKHRFGHRRCQVRMPSAHGSLSGELTRSLDTDSPVLVNTRRTGIFDFGAGFARAPGARSHNSSHMEEDLEAARRGPAPSRTAHGARSLLLSRSPRSPVRRSKPS